MALSHSARAYLERVARLDTDIPPWREWCDSHREELEHIIGRQGFLKLKFSPREHLPRLLEQERLAFDPVGLSQHLVDALVGWSREPRDAFGVFDEYLNGATSATITKITRQINQIAGVGNLDHRMELGDTMMYAESLYLRGYRACATDIASVIALLEHGKDEAVDPAIEHAREFLIRVRVPD